MIKIIFLVMLPLAWSYGEPNLQGGGAFAYVDSSGHRYGGTYGLKDGRVIPTSGDPIPQHFADFAFPNEDDFGSTYFANLENLLQEFAFTNIPSLPMPMPHFGSNSAFAGAAAGPGYQHQVASIFPANPANPNVNHFADTVPQQGRNGFYSVSSNSFSSSSNVNGKTLNSRGAETVVNDNGRITHYKVEN
ncbi:uncharacterized protein LOC118274120 isoform X3 [Spodoptera frugiperda]|uniref:Uncharacterized protein LOC118274120 isoform X3 n=1 Tax=Spodoptera frugiperda TaxID=7108 RepID=A0A9R0ENE1_SPOFR|nr:uncharacterized protein LOC118274120 isoform X3 [Spodoptera frugiperda]